MYRHYCIVNTIIYQGWQVLFSDASFFFEAAAQWTVSVLISALIIWRVRVFKEAFLKYF